MDKGVTCNIWRYPLDCCSDWNPFLEIRSEHQEGTPQDHRWFQLDMEVAMALSFNLACRYTQEMTITTALGAHKS